MFSSRGRGRFNRPRGNFAGGRPNFQQPVNFAEKDKLERQANDFFRHLKKNPGWIVHKTRQSFQNAFAEYSRERANAVQFESVWPFIQSVIESWYFVGYLRKMPPNQKRMTKDELRAVYLSEYRPHIDEGTGQGAVADFRQVLRTLLFNGKVLEMDGYIYFGSTDEALAQALSDPPQSTELERRRLKQIQRPQTYCPACDVDCRKELYLVQHVNGRRHKVQQLIAELRDPTSKRDLVRDKRDVSVTAEPDSIVECDSASGALTIVVEVQERVEFNMRVKNCAIRRAPVAAARTFAYEDETLTVEEFLYCFKVHFIYFNDAGNGLVRNKQKVELQPGDSLSVQVTCLPQMFSSRSVVPVVFYCRRGTQQFRIVRFIKVECVRDKALYQSLKPESTYRAASSSYKPSPLAGIHKQVDERDSGSDSDNENYSAVANPPRVGVKSALAAALTPEAPSKPVALPITTQPPLSVNPFVVQQHNSRIQAAPVLTASNAAAAQGEDSRKGNSPPSLLKATASNQPMVSAANSIASVNRDMNATNGSAAPSRKQLIPAPKLLPVRKGSADGLRLRQLNDYAITDEARRRHRTSLRVAASKGKLNSLHNVLMSTVVTQDLDEANIADRFQLMLHLEELQMEEDIQKYAIDKAELKAVREKNAVATYTLRVSGVIENRPCVLRGDILLVTLSDKQDLVYQAVVESVDGDLLRLRFDSTFVYFGSRSEATVYFQVDRVPLRFQHEALSMMKLIFVKSKDGANVRLNALSMDADWTAAADNRDRLRAILFPTLVRYTAFSRQPSRVTLKPFFNRQLNEQQKQCVVSIVLGTHYPVPFLIFGPPGTGKTSTVAEAIKQVYNCFEKAFILVCAPENTSADHLIQAICSQSNVEQRKVLRLYATSCFKKVPDFIENESKCFFDFMDDGYPTVATLKSYRIVVTTLNTATRLAFSGFPRDHFTHLFIDEAGHATESEVFTPITCLLSQKDSASGGQLIMAGDPCQLGVTVRSALALKFRLDRSLLERLMGCDLYRVSKNTDSSDINIKAVSQRERASMQVEYDSRLMVMLRKNYRSHDAIIAFSRDRFYHKQLDACADEMFKNAFVGWEKLPNPNFPVVFHPVIGSDEQEGNSPSYFNRHEVVELDGYLKALLVEKRGGMRIEPKDIGIISPYKGQNAKIRTMIDKRYASVGKGDAKRSDVGIMVGTVEEFQGQERTVIIISTVRSSEKLLNSDTDYQVGFVDRSNSEYMNVCMKRINVALTRAKSLLIVIGNPFILEQDLNWKRWLQYCDDNKAWAVSKPQIEKLRNQAKVNDVVTDEADARTKVSRRELQEEPQWLRRE